MDERSLDRTSAELTGWPDALARLRDALHNDEFELYCQPILALGGEARYPIAEVLVRLREEERALLPPGEFLPAFEHYGMMPELDRWVLRHVVSELARGSRFARFTVNVSGQTLRDSGFPAFAATELRAAGVAMNAVMFEIDESDVLDGADAAERFAASVRVYGGGVLIDGFCRRAVTFAPFKALQPHYVKVDGTVTRRILAHEPSLTKLKAVLRVCQALNIGVIAECVEDQDVLARLKALDVGFAQGFGVVQPQPIRNFSVRP